MTNLNNENILLVNEVAANLRSAGTGFPRSLWYSSTVIKTLCISYAANPDQSKKTILKVLNNAQSGESSDELGFLAEEIVALSSHDFEVVEEIFKTTFGGIEETDETISLGGSGKFNLTTTTRQIHNQSRYQLINHFSQLFGVNARRTLRLLIALVGQEVDREQKRHKQKSESWTIGSTTFSLMEDGSRYWEDYNRTYGVIALIRKAEETIVSLASNPITLEEAVDLVRLVMQEGQYAILWRMILRVCGSDRVFFCGGIGVEVCSMEPLIRCLDTYPVFKNCVAKKFAGLERGERERIEDAINSAIRNAPTYEKQVISDILSTLSDDKGLEPETEQKQAGRCSDSFAQGLQQPKVFLPAQFEESFRCLDSIGRALNATLTVEECRDLLIPMGVLLGAAESPSSIDPKIVSSIRRVLASAGRIIAPTVAQSNLPFIGLRNALFFAAEDESPRSHSDDDEFNYGTRSDAASGIISLAYRSDTIDDEMLSKIRQLAADEVGTVRREIFEKITHLYAHSRDVMVELLIRSCMRERNPNVLLAVMFQLERLKGVQPSCVSTLVRVLLRRLRRKNDRDSKEVRHYGATLLLTLGLVINDQSAQRCLDRFLSEPLLYRTESTTILANLENGFAMNVEESENVDPQRVRRLTINLAKKATQSIRKELAILEAKLRGPDPANEDLSEAIRHLGFASLYLTQSIQHAIERVRASEQSQSALSDLLQLLEDVIGDLCEIGVSNAVDKFIETFTPLIPIAPERVFIWLSRCITASMPYGYLNDRLAADDVMKVMRLFLADFRHIFQANKSTQEALIKIFDAMVGWPDAWQLAYQMDDLFR